MNRKAGTLSIIRGGRLLDARAHRAEPADLLIDGATIVEVRAPGPGRRPAPRSSTPAGCCSAPG